MAEAKTYVKVRVSPANIAFLVQVMEGYGHIGVVTTTDPKTGDVALQVTPDTYEAALTILKHMPIEVQLL